jgi:hypothetical protein
LEALAAELCKPKMVCFFMNDPERNPDEFRKELIATGKCSPNDDIRLVRYLTRSEAARLEDVDTIPLEVGDGNVRTKKDG